jgi:hypothetical protein
MRLISRIKLCSILVFAILTVGCSPVSTSSRNEESGMKYSSNPTPNNSRQENEAKALKQESCKIPLLEKRIKIRTYVTNLNSEDGKLIKVTTTAYDSKGELFFTREAPTAEHAAELNYGWLKLEWLEELKVKDKIFGYLIFVRGAKPDEKTKKPLLDKHMFVYRCVDFDGDGTFESILTDTAKELLVPKWAA